LNLLNITIKPNDFPIDKTIPPETTKPAEAGFE